MKVPLKWLAQFVRTGLSPQELAHRLTMAGLEAEKITQIGEMWGDKVFVAQVNDVSKHPDADRLVLADVQAGEHRLTVVTGAPNIAAGQKVVLALAGARLYDGHSDSPTPEIKTLKPGSIRGIKSEGMVCSEKELGISDEHEGILVLPDDAPVGTPFVDYYGDTVIEFEITPNLAHAFSINGIAREVHALLDVPVTEPPLLDLSLLADAPDDAVVIADPERCHRYMVLLVDNLVVGPSPVWMVQRLEAAGMRSINNVVDMTNYVMHEFGFPMHAFDRDKLAGGRVIVRAAKPGEHLETLDHIERQLSESMTVIADLEKPVGLAGIMGGFEAEVSDATTRLLLEVAHFDPTITRATSRALKLRTDASARYERGLDPAGIPIAVARAAQLIRELCPGATLAGLADAYPVPVEQRAISFPFDRIEQLLGMRIDERTVLDLLRRLEFDADISDGVLSAIVPTYRRDVRNREDIIEEVARIAGYDLLPATLPSGEPQHVHRDPMYRLRKAARSVLVGAGFNEAITYVTLENQDIDRFSDGAMSGIVVESCRQRLIHLRNALQADRDILRSTLIPSLLGSLSANLNHEPGVRLAEIARVYAPHDGEVLPQEVEVAGLVAAGRAVPLGLDASDDQIDFFDLKGTIALLLERLGVTGVQTERWSHPAFHPGRAAQMRSGDRVLARFGELHPEIASAYGIADVRVLAGEINLSAALSTIKPRGRDAVVPRFLPVQQDFAVVVRDEVPAADVEAAFRAGAGPLLTGITLFDQFRGSQIGEGNVSMAWRLTFTAPDRTLTDNDLVKIRPKIEKTLKQRVGGSLRV
jgi:phenylalanyl-tRNA synthetase beta chain